MIREEDIKTFWPYYDHPVVNKETGEWFENAIQWANAYHKSETCIYDLIMENDEWGFEDEDKLRYPFGDGTMPENASIADVKSGKAQALILYPFK